jgi:hypothetical protein
MKTYTGACRFAGALVLAGCATMGGDEPTVDPTTIPMPAERGHKVLDCVELWVDAATR